jgi:chromosome segregation ATPase
MWPLHRGPAPSGEALAELSRQCQKWDRELAKSEAAIADFQHELRSKAAAAADFEESLDRIEGDQLVFDRLISEFEQSPPPAQASDRDLLDDAKSLYLALDHHEAELSRMRARPCTHREFLYAIADLEQALQANAR